MGRARRDRRGPRSRAVRRSLRTAGGQLVARQVCLPGGARPDLRGGSDSAEPESPPGRTHLHGRSAPGTICPGAGSGWSASPRLPPRWRSGTRPSASLSTRARPRPGQRVILPRPWAGLPRREGRRPPALGGHPIFAAPPRGVHFNVPCLSMVISRWNGAAAVGGR
jgi:hypothetical protein